MWQTHIQKLMLHLKDRFFTIFHRFLHRIDFGICLNSFETIFLRNFLSILLILVCVITSPESSHPSRIPSSHQNKLFYLVFILRIFVSSIRCTELYRFFVHYSHLLFSIPLLSAMEEMPSHISWRSCLVAWWLGLSSVDLFNTLYLYVQNCAQSWRRNWAGNCYCNCTLIFYSFLSLHIANSCVA